MLNIVNRIKYLKHSIIKLSLGTKVRNVPINKDLKENSHKIWTFQSIYRKWYSVNIYRIYANSAKGTFQILALCIYYICHATLLAAQIREESDIEEFQNTKTGKYPTSIESLASARTVGALHWICYRGFHSFTKK